MDSQVYKAWSAGREVPTRLVVEGLRDEDDGLVIRLRADDGTVGVTMSFDQVVAYRCIDESYRHRTWRSLQGQPRPSLLVVENSRWVEWLRAESDGVLDEFELTHIAVFTQDDCIDVVARVPPKLVVTDQGTA